MTNHVVVTGAAGFIGRWVTRELLDRGYSVRGLDDLSNGSDRNVAEFEDKQNFELTVGDVRDAETVESLFGDETVACFHLGAKIDVERSLNDPQSHFTTNVTGTHNVLEACRKTDTRLGLVGTCMVYDMAGSGGGINEDHQTKPASPYAGSKLAAEDLAEGYYHGYDLPVVILRPFNTYGPFQKSDMAGGVVSIFTRRDIEGKPLKIFGDGTQTRDLLYATDCARFIVEATFDDNAIGEVLNAGTGTDISINSLAELIASEDTDITHVDHHHPQSEVQKLRCDRTKAQALLDWEPEVSLEEGVSRLREWMRTHESFDPQQ
ncbi:MULTISPECIES: dTDP-glucose 4,6-dehydratase [Halobacterium]|uniref:dTDP-glucose 4,6-dehydratase n=1 Tax=Halobacterium TaxID=2239 RepID=UPI001964669D|nr:MULTISPECIES: GDP-mannose 4,6-dehydratase [Halobacterium]MCF2207521.1 GDP-mannose 4,6-dehydratase [Halobacterium salinarum]MCF2240713.1 GDP-mannose 4,6-dehydratase [Halobacterium salinarum]QRY23498.1 GDP-mannose 4,6-dehydratase [Halobacterium sp. GSL-19]WJK62935.1 GDP-mannose 4,6-dehydratase [Halobacterium salinarum]